MRNILRKAKSHIRIARAIQICAVSISLSSVRGGRKLLTLDVGCGWVKGHKKRGEVGLDLHKEMCDIVGDAQHLPFREQVFDRVLLYAVLEHLDDPLKCLGECKRVARQGAYFEILIPIDYRDMLTYLKMLIFEFPFNIRILAQIIWRRYKHRDVKGLGHKRVVLPYHVSRVLKVEAVKTEPTTHSWFRKPTGGFFSRIIKTPPSGVWKNYLITARKNNGY